MVHFMIGLNYIRKTYSSSASKRSESSIHLFDIFSFSVVFRSLTSMCSAPLRGVSDTIIAMNDNEQPGKYATMKRGKGRRDAPDAR
jgi:hypothetical protein